MEDLRKKKEIEQLKNEINKQKFYTFLKKHKYKIFIISITILLFLFPVEIGTYIGKFITNFLGSIIKNIHL